MKITELSAQDKLKFNKLAQSYGTIFNTIEWSNIFSNCLKRYGIYNKGGELIGGFFLYKEKKYCLSIYRNPPFTPEIGPFLKIDAKNPVSIMDTWKKALTLMVESIEQLDYSIISITLNKNIIDMQPFFWSKFKVIPVCTYVLDLNLSSEDIWKRMSNERRKNINKGLKDGLSIKKTTDFEMIKSLVLKTFSKQKKGINVHYLDKILFEFANSENSFAFVTFNNNNPLACSFCVHDKDVAYYILGGYDHENKHHGAGTLSMWEAIKYARSLGIKHFDFEGSMILPIERYFRGFGGQLTPYYCINKAKLPIEMLLKFCKRELF